MLKLNVGFSRKTGEANYGSRGASVNLELEFESGLACDPERLKERIRFLFAQAKTAVDEELHGQTVNARGSELTPSKENGQANGYRRDSARPATASQVRALHAIAQHQQLDATNLAQCRFGVDRPEDLTIIEASELIDELKSLANETANSS